MDWIGFGADCRPKMTMTAKGDDGEVTVCGGDGVTVTGSGRERRAACGATRVSRWQQKAVVGRT